MSNPDFEYIQMRERARRPNGQFGTQPPRPPEVDITKPEDEWAHFRAPNGQRWGDVDTTHFTDRQRQEHTAKLARVCLDFDREYAQRYGIWRRNGRLDAAVREVLGISPVRYTSLLLQTPEYQEGVANAPFTPRLRSADRNVGPEHAEVQAYLYGQPIRTPVHQRFSAPPRTSGA